MSSIEARVSARLRTIDRAPPSEALPPEAPLSMPVQELDQTPTRKPLGADKMVLRRLTLLAFTVAMTVPATWLMHRTFSADRLTVVEGVQLSLFASLFAWTAFAFASATAGFIVSLRRDRAAAQPSGALTSRNAILAPVYNEQPGPVFARLQVMLESLQAEGVADRFDLFVLSDTRYMSIAALERAQHEQLQMRFAGVAKVHYRRRAQNTDRKAGNVAEWVRRFGAAYDHMVVLDADSLMTGEAMLRLAVAMQDAPRCALIQTVPTIVNGRTLFARTEQFASRLYGPMFARGLEWWSGSESSYWGHNAIIRVAAFAEQAGLPHLRGPKPFGGHIMSHDFVEAALMRRGGWEIRLAPEIAGSYEEGPPTLVDQIVRDRRWCQGNLQHIGVLAAKGLHPLSRFHLLRGFSTYLTAPLWLGLLTLGLLLACFPELGGAADSAGLAYEAVALWAVFGLSLAFLLLPKLMAAALVVWDREAGFGSVRRLLGGIAVEVVVSSLTAPIMLLAQTAAIAQILSGQDSGWATQRRDADQLTLLQALRLHRAETVLGAVLLGLSLAFEPAALPWVAIPAVALVSAFAISALTARPADRLRLLLTPEMQRPPAILRRARMAMGAEPTRMETPRRRSWLKAPSLPEPPIAPGLPV